MGDPYSIWDYALISLPQMFLITLLAMQLSSCLSGMTAKKMIDRVVIPVLFFSLIFFFTRNYIELLNTMVVNVFFSVLFVGVICFIGCRNFINSILASFVAVASSAVFEIVGVMIVYITGIVPDIEKLGDGNPVYYLLFWCSEAIPLLIGTLILRKKCVCFKLEDRKCLK